MPIYIKLFYCSY